MALRMLSLESTLMFLARPVYRIRQFAAGFRARIDRCDRGHVQDCLGEKQWLFYTMTIRDQRHCLDVFYHLRKSGCSDENLLSAALLHDVGKGNVRMWHRAAYVVLSRAAPRWLTSLGRQGEKGWRGALPALGEHPKRGAELAEAAGVSHAVVQFIAHHEGGSPAADPALNISLLRLREADDSC